MFGLKIDLRDLAEKSEALTAQIGENIETLAKELPNFPVKEYLAKMTAEFEERKFSPEDKLSDVWNDALGDLFDDGEAI